MPNPYDDIFGSDGRKKDEEPIDFGSNPLPDDDYPMGAKDPLDEILDKVKMFTQRAEAFSQLLSKMRAIDYKDEGSIARYFVVAKDKHDQKSLAGERAFHAMLTEKFVKIIVPMRELANLHFEIVEQFNRDIDKHYYSFDKTDKAVESDKELALNGINMQRRILGDAETSLELLRDALVGTERRIHKYINAGGYNNISSSEYEIIYQKREMLTSGRNHRFDYGFFNVNLIDKTALVFNVYMKKTTSQYLGKLKKALY